jgi:hypothetical protein
MANPLPDSFGLTRAAAASGGEAAFQGMAAAFDDAFRTQPGAVYTAWFAFAGRPVRMRVLGRELSEGLGRPFAHLAAAAPSPANPQLTIDAWDEQEAALCCPPLARDAVPGPGSPFEGGLLKVSADGRFVFHESASSLCSLDRAQGRIVGCWRNARSLSVDERAKPFSPLLAAWHSDAGVLVIHGSLVSKSGRGLLFVGPAGSGKSTAALACLCAGFQHVSDDHAGLEVTAHGTFVGHSLYGSIRLEPRHLTRFPELAARALTWQDSGSEKALVFTSEAFPGRAARSTPLSALALPCVTGGTACRAVPVSRGKALRRLVYSSLGVSPNPSRAVETMAALVEKLPTRWLDLGGPVDGIVRCAEGLLAEV